MNVLFKVARSVLDFIRSLLILIAVGAILFVIAWVMMKLGIKVQ